MQSRDFQVNINRWATICENAEKIDPQLFDEYEVKRGLRDKNGNGVVAGLTKGSKIGGALPNRL